MLRLPREIHLIEACHMQSMYDGPDICCAIDAAIETTFTQDSEDHTGELEGDDGEGEMLG